MVSNPGHRDCMNNDCVYVEGTDTIKARVTTGLTARGKFTAVKPWETTLRMISDSIRYVCTV